MDVENPLDNYSPFDKENEKILPKKINNINKTFDEDDDDEIRKMEQRLNILESRLNLEETQLSVAQETGVIDPSANWPAFYPIVYFDIEDVATLLQPFATQAIFSWCLMLIAFSLNWIGCLSLLRAGDSTESPGSKIALASLYLFIIVPLALDLSALSVYKVLKGNPTTFSYLKIFISLGFTLLFESILSLGLESSGSCGFITMLNLLMNGHWLIGFFAIIITILLGYTTYSHYILLTGLWNHYKGTEQGQNLETDVKKSLAVMVVEALK